MAKVVLWELLKSTVLDRHVQSGTYIETKCWKWQRKRTQNVTY